MNPNTRRVLLLGALMLTAVFVFLDPFGLLSPRPQPSRAAWTAEQAADLAAELERGARPAREAFLDLFDSKDLVLAGDFMFVREEGDFVASVVPELPRKGVNILAVDFLLSADQAAIDALMNAPAFNEEEARRLLVNRNPFLANLPYLRIMEAAWKTRHDSKNPEGSLRLLGLNLEWNFALAQGNTATTDPALITSIFPKGLPDEHMAAIIRAEVLDKGQKALAFVLRESAFTRFEEPAYARQVKAAGNLQTRRMGRILFESYADRIATVIFHAPWPDSKNPLGLAWPGSGMVDAALHSKASKGLPAYPLAVNLDTSPLGTRMVNGSDYLEQADNKALPRQFRDFSSLYIVTERIASLHAAEAIPDLITTGLLPKVQQFMPESAPDRDKPEAINQLLAQKSTRIQDVLSQFVWQD